jgi:hypothetical protein
LFLILYVASGETASPTTLALTAAIEQVIGPAGEIQVASVEPADDDDAALWREASAAGATIAARVRWADATRLRARVHAEILLTGETLVRDVLFRPADSEPERGRTLGFIVGSFVVPPAPALTAGANENGERGELVRAQPTPAATATPPRPARFGLEAFMMGATAVGGQGDSLGGGAGLRWPAEATWGLRVGARARVGSIPVAQASLLAAAAYAGLWRRLLPAADHPFNLSGRLDALLAYESLTHFSDDDPAPVRQARLLPGAAAAVELEVRLTETAAGFVAGGGEVLFGRSTVVVHERPVAELVPFRGLFEAGFRARF